MMTLIRRINTMVSCFIFCSFVGSTVHAGSLYERLSDVPLPPNARLHSIGTDIRQNGTAIAVARFDGTQAVPDTVEFYRSLWSSRVEKEAPGLVENRLGEWLYLAHLERGIQTVLQLRLADQSRSSGYLSVMSINEVRFEMGDALALPGLEHLSSTHSRDIGMASELSVYQSSESVDSLVDQLLRYWKRDGWGLVSRESYEQSKVLLFNRRSSRMEVVVTAEQGNGTLLIVNRVNDDA